MGDLGALALHLIPMNIENTYVGEDGLLYCTKCHTRRCTKEPMQPFGKRMPVVCECMKEAERKEEERKAQEEKLRKLDRLRGASLLGDRYKDTTFDKTDLERPEDFQRAYQRCRKYCQIPDQALEQGYGLYIYGEGGTGKTHLTAGMCNELVAKMRQCLFTNFFEISKLIRSTWNGNADSANVINRICEVDFLFLDDLGTEALTKNGEDNWLQGQVFDIINKRYNNKKPTIFSSNYSLNELITDRGMMKKTVDRIGEMSTAMVKLSGESYRRKNRGGVF
jgi:DNA replication protein DnaC